MKKLKIGFWLLLLGGFFLWNPIIGVKDFLPDAIGYFLLLVGLSRLADLNDDLAEARQAFRSMLWVSLLQIAAWILVSRFLHKTDMDMNQYEEPVWVLVFALVFLALEWYLMIPAWKLFFKGLSDLAQYHGGSALLTEVRGKSLCERMIANTRAFIIIKALLTVLPEASVLTTFESEVESKVFFFDWFPFLSTFRTVAFLVGLLPGLIWLVGFLRLMRGALRDKPWQASLAEYYHNEITPDVGFLLNRRVRDSFAFFKIGIVFCINLTMQYRTILPDWISVILFLCGGILLGMLVEGIKPCLVSGGLLFVVGIIRTFLQDSFLKDEWTPEAALVMPDVADRYLVIRIFSWAEAAMTFVFVWCVLRALFSMARKHTSVDYSEDPALSERATARLHADLWKRSLYALIAFGFSSVSKILEIELQPIQEYSWIWLLQVGCSFVAVLFFCAYLDRLAEAIADRYPAKRRIN